MKTPRQMTTAFLQVSLQQFKSLTDASLKERVDELLRREEFVPGPVRARYNEIVAEQQTARDARLVAEAAASLHLDIRKLEAQHSDQLDFREVYLPNLARALEHAYRAGLHQGQKAAAEKVTR